MLTFLHWLVCVLICAAYILFVNPYIDSPFWQTVAWWVSVALGVLCFAKFVRKWVIPVAAITAATIASRQITDSYQQAIAVWGLGAVGTLMLLGAIVPILVNNFRQWARNRAYEAPSRDRQKVERLQAKHNVRGLTKMLSKNAADSVRQAAAVALGALRDKRAVDHLIQALTQEKDRQVRTAVVCALGQIGDQRAVDPLVNTVTHDQEPYVRAEAVSALGQLGDKRVIPLLCVLLENGYVGRKTCTEALDRLGWQPTSDRVGAWYWITKGEYKRCAAIGTPAVEPLIQNLNSYSSTSNYAAGALDDIGDARAVPPLITALTRGDKVVRLAAAQALTHMYVSGALGDKDKQLILAQRETIIQKHADEQIHESWWSDTGQSSDCTSFHNDSYRHVDKGIGVPFPG